MLQAMLQVQGGTRTISTTEFGGDQAAKMYDSNAEGYGEDACRSNLESGQYHDKLQIELYSMWNAALHLFLINLSKSPNI